MKSPNFPRQRAVKGRSLAGWATVFIGYLGLKANLLLVESEEAIAHLVRLLVLLGVLLMLALASALMDGASRLDLIGQPFHLSSGWSAVICAAILTISRVATFLLLRARLRKPVFQMT
jgi:hypothetical protein